MSRCTILRPLLIHIPRSAKCFLQDKNGDGSITHAEFIKGLRDNPWIAALLGTVAYARPVVLSCRIRASMAWQAERASPTLERVHV
jgi:hypothetical protein